jgi:ubiquinone/menaquinone biosynthesis C-methylase UbiE
MTHDAPVKPVDYDTVAAAFGERYQRNRYAEVRECLQRFLDGAEGRLVEVGCGTGHWLAEFAAEWDGDVVGIDNSAGMLEKARSHAPDALLIRAHAAALPLASGSVDGSSA